MKDWVQKTSRRWVRSDGAVVKWDDSSPHPNPERESSRMWTAWEPDPSPHYLATTRGTSLFIWQRRWKTAAAAMAAVDREYPLGVKFAEIIGPDGRVHHRVPMGDPLVHYARRARADGYSVRYVESETIEPPRLMH
jgi:hypothetical protein